MIRRLAALLVTWAATIARDHVYDRGAWTSRRIGPEVDE